MKATIFNIQKFCLQDGPGIRTTVFFKGCPLLCVWCHNPESRKKEKELMFFPHKCVSCLRCLPCPARKAGAPGEPVLLDRSKCVLCGQCVNACLCDANVFVGEEKETSEIFSKVMEDRIFYKNGGGMTLSGGEPALQGDASLELLSLSEKAGISRAVETSGYGDSAFFTDANRLGALFLYDLKGIDDAKHLAHTGVSNRLVLENFEKLCSLSAEIIPRIPLIPGMNDTEKDLSLLKDFLLSHAGCFSRIEIMKYHILGIGKASSLGIGYEAPKESATEEDTARWLSALSSDKWETVLS